MFPWTTPLYCVSNASWHKYFAFLNLILIETMNINFLKKKKHIYILTTYTKYKCTLFSIAIASDTQSKIMIIPTFYLLTMKLLKYFLVHQIFFDLHLLLKKIFVIIIARLAVMFKMLLKGWHESGRGCWFLSVGFLHKSRLYFPFLIDTEVSKKFT